MHDIKKICALSNCYGCLELKQYLKKNQIKLRVSSYDEHNLCLCQSGLVGAHVQGAKVTDSTKMAIQNHLCRTTNLRSCNAVKFSSITQYGSTVCIGIAMVYQH